MTSLRQPRFLLTAQEMRVAEQRLFATGIPSRAVMERAGDGVAAAVAGYAGPAPTLVLCGPGNNGGDGYVVARLLKRRGWPVRVAALASPGTADSQDAAAGWDGPVEALEHAKPAPILIDALFGTGLSRTLDAAVAEPLHRLMAAARTRVAVDVPSGVDTDSGALLGVAHGFDMTVAIGALKPAHLLHPAAGLCGRLVVAGIGVDAVSSLTVLAAPRLSAPGPEDHKYRRGFVMVVGGAMPGAAELAGQGAMASGAGYGVVASLDPPFETWPHALIRRQAEGEALERALEDARIGAVAVGPGLGRDRTAKQRLEAVLASGHRLVLDADALVLLSESALPLARKISQAAVLTPHEGEFARLFPEIRGSKIERARAAAKAAGAVVVLKGADTVIAAPDGRAAVNRHASNWLATAGTGDVLSGVIAAMLARGLEPFEAACAGVWLHGEASLRAGPVLVADDLITHLPRAVAACSAA